MRRFLSMPIFDWPEADQRMWSDLVANDDPLSDSGALAHLRETSRQGLIKFYGRWLEWLYRTEPIVLASSPPSRATVDRFRAWLEDLADLAAPTCLTFANGALQVLRAAYPQEDWRVHLRLLQPLRIKVENWHSDRKQGRVVSGAVVLDKAISLCGPEADLMSSKLYAELVRRDGTMMAFLMMMPIRLRAFSELALGTSVLVSPSQIKIALSEDMTKNGMPWEALAPAPLEGLLRRYIDGTRAWLMARSGARHHSLWVTMAGMPLAYGYIKTRIPQVTERTIGIMISPHLFRDIAVTTLVRASPSDALLTRPLLAHASFGIVERHYNHAKGIEAGRDYAAVIASLRGGT